MITTTTRSKCRQMKRNQGKNKKFNGGFEFNRIDALYIIFVVVLATCFSSLLLLFRLQSRQAPSQLDRFLGI